MEKLRDSLEVGSFVKITLSKPCGEDLALRNCYGRLIDLKDGPALSLLYRYATRDVTKNNAIKAGTEKLGEMLGGQFEEAHLFTTGGDWRLRWNSEGIGGLKASRPVFAIQPTASHDRVKTHALENSAFLQALGVTHPDGASKAGMADKLRQVQRFVEILGHHVNESPLHNAKSVKLCDMGAGKGYLTFAAHEFFLKRGVEVQSTGVELRSDLVEKTNAVAVEVGFTGLQFVEGSIGSHAVNNGTDILIALHACDTATDDALFAAIQAGASLILTAPCCHKEVRRQMHAPPVLGDIVKHGILEERQSELLTDALRSLLLEMHGYSPKVFEFISNEHTAKNLMISAVKRAQKTGSDEASERFRELIQFFGVKEQHLAILLGKL